MRVSYSFARARPEPAGLPGRRGFRRQPAGGAARADAALVRSASSSRSTTTSRSSRPARSAASNKRRVKIQLAPANLHWCSDEALRALRDRSRKYNVPHAHAPAWRPPTRRNMRGAAAAARRSDYIERFGLLGPQPDAGPRRLAERGRHRAAGGDRHLHLPQLLARISVCARGVAPLNVFEAGGINTAMGLDEAGINDDRDMLQEMRLVLRAASRAGHGRRGADARRRCSAWRPSGGAKTTPFGERLGTLEVGKRGRHGADRLAAGQPTRISMRRRRCWTR